VALRAGADPAPINQLAGTLIGAVSGDQLDELAIWQIDHCYRLLHRLDFVDRASFLFAHAVVQPLNVALITEGKAIAYLVDNEIPHDRLVPGAKFFAAMGRVVASPELIAAEMARVDGLEVDDVLGAHLAKYLVEATSVALRLAERLIRNREPFLWISGNTPLDVYQAIASKLDDSYLGVFRNQPPDDGTTVQVFRRLADSSPIDPQY
jgi:hypothetical protein